MFYKLVDIERSKSFLSLAQAGPVTTSVIHGWFKASVDF